MISILISVWIGVVYKPIYNLVVFSYNLTPGPNFGLAIIGLSVLIRFLLLYFTLQGYRHDKMLDEVKPQIAKIEHDDRLSAKDKLQKISDITKPLGVNPVTGSIPLFAQLLFLGVLYQIIQVGLKPSGYSNLYSFVSHPVTFNTDFLGFNMAHPSIILALIAVFFLFLERVWEYNEKKDIVRTSFSQMWDPLIWPLGSLILLLILPSAKAIFLITSVAFSLTIKSIVHLTSYSKG
jgi:membrane protein insertase Oxa1/YidC/SpoIIIJ